MNWRPRPSANLVPLLATITVCALLYALASYRYPGFFSTRVFVNFFADNAFVGISAVGMTFVILSGGIDLSVGSVLALTSVMLASLTTTHAMHPALVLPLVLIAGTAFGAAMGCLIQFFQLAPFFVTLAGMFLARGLGQIVSLESVPLDHPLYVKLSEWGFSIGEQVIPLTAILFVIVALAGIYVAHFTRFGRTTYAIGGNETSAALMGLKVARTKILIYALSGFCSSLAGIVFGLYTLSGNSSAGVGMELQVIAAVVLGGTLLSGGVGSVFGTVLGVLILGIIQSAIIFDGRLNTWWTPIATGGLLLIFIILQKLLAALARPRARAHPRPG
jgi:simple sugar transport system permease protein